MTALTTQYQGFILFVVHVSLPNHFSAPGQTRQDKWINKLCSQPHAPASYRLTFPLLCDLIWTQVRSLPLQPHCAHSCSHSLNQSGCSERAELHLSLCDRGTAGSCRQIQPQLQPDSPMLPPDPQPLHACAVPFTPASHWSLPAQQGTQFPSSYPNAVNRNTDYFHVRLLIASTCCTGWDVALASPHP